VNNKFTSTGPRDTAGFQLGASELHQCRVDPRHCERHRRSAQHTWHKRAQRYSHWTKLPRKQYQTPIPFTRSKL